METAARRRAYDLVEPDQDTVYKAHRLQRTLEAAELLHSTLDIKQLTSIILDIIRSEMPVERVTAFVVDRNTNVLRSLVAQGVDGDSITTPMGMGIAGYVASTGRAANVPDAYADPQFDPTSDQKLGFRTHDILALPIRSAQGEVTGVLELLNRRHPFRRDDLEFLQDVSVFIALALENAGLHEELRSKARLEEEVARSRERLGQMDRLVLTNEVLYTVMNEMSAAANIIVRQTAMMKNDPIVADNILPNIQFIEAAMARSTEAIRSFLEFAQKQKGDRGPVDVRDLVRNTIAFRSAQWSIDAIDIAVQLDEIPAIQGSYGELQQALIHIIRNAEDAVTTRESDRRIGIHVHISRNARNVAIDVKDNGGGIPTEIYERIFEPFFSTRSKAVRTGLGLSIASRIIQEHGGEIAFDTTFGQGSVFTIELPI
jgi:signal transduction histidine kinase